MMMMMMMMMIIIIIKLKIRTKQPSVTDTNETCSVQSSINLVKKFSLSREWKSALKLKLDETRLEFIPRLPLDYCWHYLLLNGWKVSFWWRDLKQAIG